MGNYATLIAQIQNAIYSNNQKAISGNILQTQLVNMINSLGAGYQWVGVATPENPGTDQAPDYKCFYVATTAGTYSHLGGLVVGEGEVAILYWDSAWHKATTGAATSAALTGLGTQITELGQYINNSEWVRVVTDTNNKILYGVRENGDFFFGKGIPPQVQIEIEKRVLKEKGKTLIDGEIANLTEIIENVEYARLVTDTNGKVLCVIRNNGSVDWQAGIPTPIMQELNAIKEHFKTDEDGLRVLPDYYFENDYISGRISAINTELRKCAINGDAFFWITDIHWDHFNQRLSPSLIKYIRENTTITRLLCGGDISDGWDGDNQTYIWKDHDCMMDFINKCRSAIGSNMLYATYGNHDLGNEATTYDEIFYEYGLFRENVVYADSAKTAYYVDNAPQKMRYIALGEWGINDGHGYESLLTPSVISWFEDVALDVESGWTIVVIAHGLYTSIQGTENIQPYIDPDTGTWAKDGNGNIIQPVSGCTDIIDIIDNYKANGGLGDIACVLMGHWHADRIQIGRVISPATVGVPYVLTQSDQFHDSRVGGLSDVKVPRTPGTITEQHFEVVVVNKDERKVKLFAIGSQSRDGIGSNVGDLVDVRVVNY